MIRCQDNNLPWHERALQALYVYLRKPHASLHNLSPMEIVEGVLIPESPVREGFVDEELDSDSSSGPEFETGDNILWKDRQLPKDRHPWREGKIVEVLGRGGYKAQFGRVSRKVNEELLTRGEPRADETQSANPEIPEEVDDVISQQAGEDSEQNTERNIETIGHGQTSQTELRRSNRIGRVPHKLLS